MNSEQSSGPDGVMVSAPRGKCLYAWNPSSGRWVAIGSGRCSSGKTCPHSSDVQARLSGYPTSGQYPLSCISSPTIKQTGSLPAPTKSALGPVYVSNAGYCTYAWSASESRWTAVATPCSSGMTCPHSSDARNLLYGLPIGGQYLLSCVSAIGVEDDEGDAEGCGCG